MEQRVTIVGDSARPKSGVKEKWEAKVKNDKINILPPEVKVQKITFVPVVCKYTVKN